MKIRGSVLGLVAACSVAACGWASLAAAAPAPNGSASIETRLPGYLNNFLPFDPASKVTVEKTADKIPGFETFKIKRTGKFPKLGVEKNVSVSNDGKWFFDGDAVNNASPVPVRTAADLAWLEARISSLYRSKVQASLAPERDAAGFKGVTLAVESGYGPVRLPGYVLPDGSKFLGGVFWDFQMDPREERKRKIDLSTPRFQGRSDGAITIVEYADMECGYCKYRGLQMDTLLEKNAKVLSYKRQYKFFPLWFNHAWAFKAASAGDCLFRFAGKAAPMFDFKKHVYMQQATMTVAQVDELALTEAEAAGIARTDFLGCYLREESLANVRKDVEEGQRLGVKSTPTYFVDGTEISWVEDMVMEDFLRTKVPSLQTIDYGPKP